MRIIPILLISLLFVSACGKTTVQPIPKPITPIGTGSVVDLPEVSISKESETSSGK